MTADIVVVDEMKLEEARAVLEIYTLGIASGQATFETVVPDWAQWAANYLKMCRLVARLPTQIVGWAALSAASKRIVYAGVAEVSIYVHP